MREEKKRVFGGRLLAQIETIFQLSAVQSLMCIESDIKLGSRWARFSLCFFKTFNKYNLITNNNVYLNYFILS